MGLKIFKRNGARNLGSRFILQDPQPDPLFNSISRDAVRTQVFQSSNHRPLTLGDKLGEADSPETTHPVAVNAFDKLGHQADWMLRGSSSNSQLPTQ